MLSGLSTRASPKIPKIENLPDARPLARVPDYTGAPVNDTRRDFIGRRTLEITRFSPTHTNGRYAYAPIFRSIIYSENVYDFDLFLFFFFTDYI